MKRILSIILALTMILSTVAFAVPTMVSTVETTAEIAEDSPAVEELENDATVMAENNYGTLVFDIDFSKFDKTIGGHTYLTNYVTHERPEGLASNFPYEKMIIIGEGSNLAIVTAEDGNKYMSITSTGQYPCFKFLEYDYLETNGTLPGGKYTVVMDLWADGNNANTVKGASNTTAEDGTVTNVTTNLSSYSIYVSQNIRTSKSIALRTGSNQTFSVDELASPRSTTVSIYGYKGEVKDTDTCDTFEKIQVVLGSSGTKTTTVTDAEGTVVSTDTANVGRFDTKNIFYVDNVKLYYKPEANDVVSIDYHDYRHGYIDITLAKDYPEITEENACNLFVKSTSLFKAAAKKTVNADGTVTFRLYNGATFLRNQSVTLNGFIEFDDRVLNLNTETLTHKYNELDMTQYDGENLIANGDLSNKYYTGAIKTKDRASFVIDDEGVVFTLLSTATPWNNMQFNNFAFEEAKYFVEFELEHVSASKVIPANPSYSVSMYMPFSNNDTIFDIGSNTYYSTPSHIPSAKNKTSYDANADVIKNNTPYSVTNRRMLDLTVTNENGNYTGSKKDYTLSQMVTDFYPCFQFCPTGGYKEKDVNGKDIAPKAEGLSFRVKYLSFKKMFTANFVDGETVLTLDIAKDVPFILPSALGEKEVAAWIDDEGGYFVAGTEYTPDVYVAEGISFSPVYADAPYNRNKTSIRFTAPGGIRFLASVTDSQRKAFDEYGFIVTRKTILDKLELENDALTFELDKGTYVYGQSYLKDGDKLSIDKVYELSEDKLTTFFTAVVTGIPETHYNDVLVARPYAKTGDVYSYGEITQSSILDTVKKIRDGGYKNLTDEQIAKCYDILLSNNEYLYETAEGYVLVDDNAENGNWVGFVTGSSENLDMVADPLNENNTVYSITTKKAVQNWNYIWSPRMFNFKENEVYKISYDILLSDTDASGQPVTKANSSCAFNFGPVDKGFVSGSLTSAVSDKWVSGARSSKIVYSKDAWTTAASNSADTESGLDVPTLKFGVYVDPGSNTYTETVTNKDGSTSEVTRKYACNFYIDNIKLIKIK